MTMAWSIPDQSGPRQKTEYEIVISELAEVAAQLSEGRGDRQTLQQKRAELVQRFHELKDFKLPD